MEATRCKRGHLRTPDNLYANGTCKACMRERSQSATLARGGTPRTFDPDTYPCGHPRTPENTKGGNVGCKTCHSEAQRRRYHEDPQRYRAASSAYQKANRKAADERQARWRIENAERYKAKTREWLLRTKGQRRATREAYYEANRDRLRARDREARRRWMAANREVSRLHVRNRHRLVRLHPHFVKISLKDWTRTINRFRGCCAYCGVRTADLHMDHVIPVSKGGRHALGNVVPACRACNGSKGSKFLAVWRYRHASYQRRVAS